MPSLAYLGNDIDAAGWRLAGALAMTPAAGQEVAAFEQVRAQAALVLLAPAVAQALPAALLEAALAAPRPLVLVLPAGGEQALDPAERVRRQLGIEAEPADGAARDQPAAAAR